MSVVVWVLLAIGPGGSWPVGYFDVEEASACVMRAAALERLSESTRYRCELMVMPR